MAITFGKVTRRQLRARIALFGPSGSGKSYTALRMIERLQQTGLCKRPGAIDTENESLIKYASDFPGLGVWDFLAEMKDDYSPRRYVEALKAAAEAGIDALLIDSLSHAWSGKGGALEMKDNAARKGGNDFTAWRNITPLHNEMVEALLAFPGHLIVSMRAKQEYVIEKDDKGKSTVRKVGMQPIQRDGLDYEFDVVCDIDSDHVLSVGKTRCRELDGFSQQKSGPDIVDRLKPWLLMGERPAAPPAAPAVPPPASNPIPPASAAEHVAPPAPQAPAPAPGDVGSPAGKAEGLTPFDGFVKAIADAASINGLQTVGAAIGAAVTSKAITPAQRAKLLEQYTARTKALAPAAVAPVAEGKAA